MQTSTRRPRMAALPAACAASLLALAACGGGGDDNGNGDGDGTSTTTLSAVPSLPADLMSKPSAANCSALRSGRYRLVSNDDVNVAPGGTTFATEVVTVDAALLTVTNSDHDVSTLTAAGPCRYTTPNGGGITVSPAGVLVAQIDTAPFRGAILFPEQSLGTSDLAGDWNTLALDRTVDNGPIHLTSSAATFSAAGKLTALTFCEDMVSCETGGSAGVALPDITVRSRADGGFDFANATDGYTDRLYAYRAGGGEVMAVILSPAGHLSFATRKVTRVLPAVGDAGQGWQVALVPHAQAPFYTAPLAISQFASTVTAVDAAAATYTRSAVIDVANSVTRPETLALNNPRDGYLRRLPGAVTASNGSTSNVSEWIGLPMRGMGLTAVGILANNQLYLSAAQAE